MNEELVNANLWKATALLLAERRRQLRTRIKDNPNDIEAAKEFVELSAKINHIKAEYLEWISKRNTETSAINRPSNVECRQ